MNDAIDIVVQPASGYVAVQLIGVLSMQTLATTRAALVEMLVDADRIVADLSRLVLRHPGCVAVFAAALQQAGGWPHAKLALTGANPRMLTHLARIIGSAVPVADSLDAALAMTDRPPRPIRSSLTHPPDEGPASPAAAFARTNPETARFIHEWLGVLIEYDVRERADLVTTLAAFFLHDHDYNNTARALGIHRSTARYRIHRIGQLTQLDLHDPETIRHLWAATRAFTSLSDTP